MTSRRKIRQAEKITDDYKDDNTWLMKGDCLERMKEIESVWMIE